MRLRQTTVPGRVLVLQSGLVLAALAALTLLAACDRSDDPPRALPVPVPSSGPAKAGDACGTLPGCASVGEADIDGDGTADTVALTRVDSDSWRLRVLFANGSAVEHPFDLTNPTLIDRPWHGAAAVDGEPGAEIALLTDLGAHTMWFTLLTYRDGRLVELDPPPAQGGQAEGWVVDSADLGWLGYTCGRSGAVSTLLVTSALRIDGPSGGEGYDETSVLFGWTGSAWREISQDTRVYAHEDPDTHRLAGWNCEGLPRFAGE